MKDQELVNEFLSSNCIAEAQIAQWRDIAGLMAVFDAIGRDGANTIVKIDGGRLDGLVYTVTISGPRLGEAFFRQDGRDLAALLRAAISFYKESCN